MGFYRNQYEAEKEGYKYEAYQRENRAKEGGKQF